MRCASRTIVSRLTNCTLCVRFPDGSVTYTSMKTMRLNADGTCTLYARRNPTRHVRRRDQCLTITLSMRFAFQHGSVSLYIDEDYAIERGVDPATLTRVEISTRHVCQWNHSRDSRICRPYLESRHVRQRLELAQ